MIADATPMNADKPKSVGISACTNIFAIGTEHSFYGVIGGHLRGIGGHRRFPRGSESEA